MEAITNFTAVLAHENDLDIDTATKIVAWLEDEGAVDYDQVKEIYGA